jgi:hypothetical protein
LARVATVVASTAKVVLLDVGTNDLNPSDTALASMQAEYGAILDALTAAGKIVLCMPIVPRGTWASYSAGQKLAAQRKGEQFNRWLFTASAARQNVYVVDCLDVFTDYTSTTDLVPPGLTAGPTSHTSDGLHPASRGGFALGQRIANIIDLIFPSYPRLWNPYAGMYDATDNPNGNMLLSPTMAGTAGFAGTGVTGSVASSWAVARLNGHTNITAVASKIVKVLDNGISLPGQQLVITNPGAAMESISFYQEVTRGSQWVAGTSQLRGMLDVEFDAGSAEGLNGIQFNISDMNGGTVLMLAGAPVISNGALTAPLLPNRAWSGRLRSPACQTQATDTKCRLEARISVAPSQVVTVRFFNGLLELEAA